MEECNSDILLSFSFCVLWKTETHTGLKRHDGGNDFWMSYHFKQNKHSVIQIGNTYFAIWNVVMQSYHELPADQGLQASSLLFALSFLLQGLVAAGFSDMTRPPEKLSVSQSCVITATGTCFNVRQRDAWGLSKFISIINCCQCPVDENISSKASS